MTVLDELKEMDSATDLYRQLVEIAGQICKLKFKSHKDVVIKGAAKEADVDSFLKRFRELLSKAEIDHGFFHDSELYDLIIKPFDQHVLDKNA